MGAAVVGVTVVGAVVVAPDAGAVVAAPAAAFTVLLTVVVAVPAGIVVVTGTSTGASSDFSDGGTGGVFDPGAVMAKA